MYPPPAPSSSGLSLDGFIGIFVILVILVIGAWLYQYMMRDQASMAYQKSLEVLRNNPDNPEIQARTLEAGRLYSKLTRNGQGVPTFDETAIRNDIDLAIAKRRTQPPKPSKSPADRLATLDGLLRDSLITESEHGEQRARILAEL